MIYVIIVESLLSGLVKASQEAYSTLEAAQAFCRSRGPEVKRVNKYRFEDRYNVYMIWEVSVKK